jgi:hypothetical protein
MAEAKRERDIFRLSLAGKPLYVCAPEDEFLHEPVESGHYSSTETTYWGFNVPDLQLNGEIYMWFHPLLNMCSSSVYIWRGLKKTTLSCEYINHFNYLPMPKGGIAEYRVEEALDLRFKVLEPLKKIQIDFRDSERNVGFSLLNEAIMSPAGRPGGHHFTQPMRVTGDLNLFGEDIKVNGFFSRDHSWSDERREMARRGPPGTWMVGVFDETFAFHATGADDASSNPEWAQRYPEALADNPLRWGYVFNEGVTTPLASMRKRTYREEDGLSPRFYELELTDVNGRVYNVNGYVQARMPWQTWQNMNVYFCQTRWECDGKIGYGDAQDIQMNDFVHNFGR